MAGIPEPGLITSAEMDWRVPARYGRVVHDRIAGSRFRVFTGPCSSHMASGELADEHGEPTPAFLAEEVR